MPLACWRRRSNCRRTSPRPTRSWAASTATAARSTSRWPANTISMRSNCSPEMRTFWTTTAPSCTRPVGRRRRSRCTEERCSSTLVMRRLEKISVSLLISNQLIELDLRDSLKCFCNEALLKGHRNHFAPISLQFLLANHELTSSSELHLSRMWRVLYADRPTSFSHHHWLISTQIFEFRRLSSNLRNSHGPNQPVDASVDLFPCYHLANVHPLRWRSSISWKLSFFDEAVSALVITNSILRLQLAVPVNLFFVPYFVS